MNRAITGCFSYAALVIVGAFALPIFATSEPARNVVLIGIVGFSIAAIVKFVQGIKPNDPYDLTLLKEVDHLKLYEGGDEPDMVSDSDLAYCIRCGEVFDSHIPICPRCKTPQGGNIF